MRLIDEIRRADRSINNRIQSIVHDSEFVTSAADAYGLPLVPNKRCGLWYVPPDRILDTAYFKSTDGHTSQWSFSHLRLNSHLLGPIMAHNGIILVDSTRRGKVMPDAFSKTVPIWCAVINMAVFGETKLYTPRAVVSESEWDQINSRIPEWVDQLKSRVPASYYEHLDKPLRPIWVTQDGPLPMVTPEFTDFYPVVLCTASKRAQDGQLDMLGFTYVQGAADDHELWAGKLTAEMLWANESLRVNSSDAILTAKVEELSESPSVAVTSEALQVSSYLFISYSSTPDFKCVIDLSSGAPPADPENPGNWPLEDGKRGARKLPAILDAIVAHFEKSQSPSPQPALIVSSPNTDFNLCVALLLDCLFFDEAGNPQERRVGHVSKEEVKRRLVKIVAGARTTPARATVNLIGSYLRS